ncbi:Putative LOC100877383, partial [Caligus rogercresseyi]
SGPAYPPSSASSSSSAHGRSSASFNSDHQVFMQQLQNFSHNFAHVTNGYPPTQYGHHPMPAHAAQGPQQQQSLRVVPSSHPGYGVAPLPAHMRSYNPSYAHRPQQPQVPNYPPAAYAAQHYPTTNLAQ